MQNNALTNYQCYPQQQNPNAVNINIYTPQAYGSTPAVNSVCPNNLYSIYGQNAQPNLPPYPANYNNMIERPMDNPIPSNQTKELNQGENNYTDRELYNKTTEKIKEDEDKDKDKKKEKLITPLTDEYVMSLENYLNDSNPKVRLIGAKELLERLKEDENRKDNPSLIPLVNKTLQDKSPAVRFLGLTMLQLDYCTGDDKTVELLKQIQSQNTDKVGEDQLLASEILLKMSAPNKIKVQNEEAK